MQLEFYSHHPPGVSVWPPLQAHTVAQCGDYDQQGAVFWILCWLMCCSLPASHSGMTMPMWMYSLSSPSPPCCKWNTVYIDHYQFVSCFFCILIRKCFFIGSLKTNVICKFAWSFLHGCGPRLTRNTKFVCVCMWVYGCVSVLDPSFFPYRPLPSNLNHFFTFTHLF